ncbi:hypothetical protein F2Q69_00009452 [Brassica cretica]|uniref:Uncharacterized protein n=1 Tax=Brassica cretica TaxID=69181 RepID=A0A8S9P6S9_BRACR|nr:hypothetical protein F2Q69_00009452 [Brassica cretica]
MGATYNTRSRRNEGGATSCSEVKHPLRMNHLRRQTLKLERACAATSVTRTPNGVTDKAVGATS